MAERVPLPGADDRVQGVVLQEKYPARSEASSALGKGSRLIRGVHHAEAVEDDVRFRAVIDRLKSLALQHRQPGAAVRAAVLCDARSHRQQACHGYPADRVRRLLDEGRWLGAARLLGNGGIIEQLGEPAACAQPHLERVDRIGAWIGPLGKVVAGGLIAQVEY